MKRETPVLTRAITSTGNPVPPSFFAFNQQYLAEQARASAEVEEATALRAERIAAFEAKKPQYKNTHPSVFTNALAREIAKYDAMNLDQLMQDKATRDETKRLLSLSKEELRAEVHNSVTQSGKQAYENRYPVFPPYIYLPGSLTKIEMNRETLLRISTVDPEFFRRLVQKYSAAAINLRLNGE